jgi:uncharacterized protein
MENDNSTLVLILKNAGNSCNIACEYCAETRKRTSAFDKNNTIAISDVKKLIKTTMNIKHLIVLFHGGEPLLLNREYYAEIMDMWLQSRQNISFGIQTNATLIDDKWIELFSNYRDILGLSVSIDGDAIANSYRRNKRGEPVYQLIINGIRLLEKNNLKTGVISTITKAAIGREQDLFNMLSNFQNLRFIKLNFCYDMWPTGSMPNWAITTTEYSCYVKNFFDILLREGAFQRLNVEPIISIIKKLMHLPSDYCNFNKLKCHYFLSVYPGGRMISCDNFDFNDGEYDYKYFCDLVVDPRTKKSKEMAELFQDFDMMLEKCQKCVYYAVCTGGCMAVRRRFKKYGKHGEYEQYCKDTQMIIDHIKMFIEKVNL